MSKDEESGGLGYHAVRRQRLEELAAQLRIVDFDPLAPVPVVLPEAAITVTRLDEVDEQADAERLRENRRHAELIAEAVAVARRTGEFRGRASDQLSDMLCEYAWKTLQSKIHSGEIAELVGKYTTWTSLHHGDAETLRVFPDARLELTGEIILRALPDFQRNALMAGRPPRTAGVARQGALAGQAAQVASHPREARHGNPSGACGGFSPAETCHRAEARRPKATQTCREASAAACAVALTSSSAPMS